MSSDGVHRTRGLLLMIVAPSGVGKTSLTRRLIADHSDLHLSISATTRNPRPGEHEWRDYHFVTRAEFDAMRERNEFLEWAEVYGNCYGSPKLPIMDALARGDSVKEVAQKVDLSSRSIEGLKYRIMQQLGLHDRVALARFAIREGLTLP